MNKIKNCIPKRCTLGGVEFTTKFVDNAENGKNYARITLVNGDISIQKTIGGIKQSHTQIQNSYFHELAHGILDQSGFNDLSDNEQLVQAIGNMIFEFARTCEWIRIEELQHNNESEATFNLHTSKLANNDTCAKD